MEKSARPRTALNECVKVVVRCRPLSEKEKCEAYEEVVKVWPSRGAVQVYNPKGQDKLFTYDAAYDSAADTQTIYDEMVRPLVASVMDGFNGCVFAYGQTGTGKTHTMEGVCGEEGIIPRAFRHIWTHIENAASSEITYLVSCSYVELYMEELRDLLAKDCKKLTIKGQELNGFYIPELTSVVCKSAADMLRVTRCGASRRAAARTDMNEHSSRSHALIMVTVETRHQQTDKIRVGKLNLVDLAGSERQRKTNAGAERLREAARINTALSSLGNVISALAENSPHVPYRDSKLTRILQDSLGGNSKTIMLAAIGPAAYNYEETITTLRYAHRAKAIKNKPIRNEDPKDAKLKEYQAEIERLRALIQQRQSVVDKRPRKQRDDKKKTHTQDDAIPETETLVLESEHREAENIIEAERNKSGELEARIRALEDRLVRGGGGGKDLINDLNETQVMLEQRNTEIAERKKREVEMQQKIELEEETTAIVTNTFATLQQEVDHKTQRIKRCLAKYLGAREETNEQREAHEAERRERESQQAALLAALRRRLLLADSFVPEAGRGVVLTLAYNEDTDAWERRAPDPTESAAIATVPRPLAAPHSRRAQCESTRATPCPPSLRCENILDLRPIPLPSTTRTYQPNPHPVPPAPAPAPLAAKKESPRHRRAMSRNNMSAVRSRIQTATGHR